MSVIRYECSADTGCSVREVSDLELEAERLAATCADCGHSRAEHNDPRWPCNVLACACRGFREA